MLQAPSNSHLAVTSMALLLTAIMPLEPGTSSRRYEAVDSNQLSVTSLCQSRTPQTTIAVKDDGRFRRWPNRFRGAAAWLSRHSRWYGWNASIEDISATGQHCPPTLLQCGGSFAGKIKNVSEGGLALAHFGSTAAEGVVTVRFVLPMHRPRVPSKGERWSGPKLTLWVYAFLHIEPGCRSSFKGWLDSLEAQLRFRESIQ